MAELSLAAPPHSEPVGTAYAAGLIEPTTGGWAGSQAFLCWLCQSTTSALGMATQTLGACALIGGLLHGTGLRDKHTAWQPMNHSSKPEQR